MTPLEPAELSAYLDGELSERARDVAAMIAASPALRDELDALARHDALWRGAARSAVFRPAAVPAMPVVRGPVLSGTAIVAFVGLLVVTAAAARMLDNVAFALFVNLVAALLVSLGVWVLAKADLASPPARAGLGG